MQDFDDLILGHVYFPVADLNGSAKPEQAKEVDVTANGTQTVVPDSGYALSSVTINTNVPQAVTQEKSVTVTENGSTTIAPDEGFTAMTQVSLTVNVQSSGASLAAFVDGTVTSVTASDLSGATKLRDYVFYNVPSLTSIGLPSSLTEIGDYALAGCTELTSITIPAATTIIGNYAFNGDSALATLTFEDAAQLSDIGNYAFQNCTSLTSLTIADDSEVELGTYAFADCTDLASINVTCNSIGDYAFNGDSAVTTVNLYVKSGEIGQYAFNGLNAVSNFTLSPQSNIAELGQYAFAQFGANRANASANVLEFDFTNSAFKTIPQYAFGSSSSSSSARPEYMTLRFPSGVNSIAGYAFRYTDNCEFYFNSTTPPTLSASTVWSNATNYQIFVPFGSINAYKTATNWAAQADYVTGYLPAETLAVGSPLPTMGAEGYTLTWYSDKDCTVSATAVENATAEYYCTPSSEKTGQGITMVEAINCTISITDSAGKSYIQGEGAAYGTVLTITIMPNDDTPQVYLAQINGTTFTSGDTVTITEGTDLSIVAACWDGINTPILPTFGDNSWTLIKAAFDNNSVPQTWNIGDTKEVELTDGNTYHIRLSDMQSGRYNKVGGGTTKAGFEFVELLPTSYAINPSQVTDGDVTAYTAGGWAMCNMKNTVLDQTIWNMLPSDLRSVISEITLNEYSYSAPSPRTSNNKLFLFAETEVGNSRRYSAEGSQEGCVQYTPWDYYLSRQSNSDRFKYKVNQTSANPWWLRSPQAGAGSSFCYVNVNGSFTTYAAKYTGGCAPCFAI
mgnify:CR=1 FL=1